MTFLVYLLVYPILWLVSRLPFRLLYALSDGVFFLLYYAIGYRKKVVRENLALVFPDKAVSERIRIEKAFFKHMCDMFLEMIKTMGISNAQLQKRFTFENLEVLHNLEAQQKSVMLMLPHYASWEWAISLDAHVASKGYGIYQVIANKYFDQLVRSIREKFGTTLIGTAVTRGTIAKNKRNGELSMYGILSDQSPMPQKAQLWTEFMDIRVPVHTGAETICRSHNLPAVYLKVTKQGRGYYSGVFHVLSENPKEEEDFTITKAFLRMVEKSIKEAPEFYFWTHKRWKHRDKNPEDYLPVTQKST
ncbi:MAG: lysophospholipid acyltransferase family protein [Bacteroidota bacterium]